MALEMQAAGRIGGEIGSIEPQARKPGRSKLVYDKTKRTIVAVAEGSQTPQALNITADDADMLADT